MASQNPYGGGSASTPPGGSASYGAPKPNMIERLDKIENRLTIIERGPPASARKAPRLFRADGLRNRWSCAECMRNGNYESTWSVPCDYSATENQIISAAMAVRAKTGQMSCADHQGYPPRDV